MRAWFCRVTCVIAVLFGLVPRVEAQETTATILGTVTDQTGSVLADVVVRLRHVATGRVLEKLTSDAGFYLASVLPIGNYEVTFNKPGFRPTTVTGVRVSVNDRVVVNGTLSVSGVSEVVFVQPQVVHPIAAV